MGNPCTLLSFDGGACLQQTLQGIVAPFWWVAYWPWALGAILVMAALYVLSKVKDIFGSNGVTLVLVIAVGALEYIRGRKGEAPLPNFPHEMLPPGHVDASPPVPRPRPKTTIFNRPLRK